MLPDNISWVEVPIIGWVVAGTVILIVTVARFGWDVGRLKLIKRRWFWALSLALAIVASISASLRPE